MAEATPVTETERVPLTAAMGRVMAADVASAIPLPPFANSAVDGFAISAADVGRPPPVRLRLVGRAKAGAAVDMEVRAGEAFRVYTGGGIPRGGVSVVPEELCEIENGSITITAATTADMNIRHEGEDVPAGATIVKAGTWIDARTIAILAAAGLDRVEVRRRVRVAILSSGDELRAPGMPLDAGAIYDSNFPMLAALLARPWIEIVETRRVRDDLATLVETIRDAAGKSDVIISSGGASRSETDLIAHAVAEAGGRAAALRVAVRPGKPVVVGRLRNTAILGLPGNPVAAMVNFLLYGRALLSRCAGMAAERPRGQPALAAAPMNHKQGRTEFAPARIMGYDPEGRPLLEKISRAGSSRLMPLMRADGLVEIPEQVGEVASDETVRFHAFAASSGW
jgi:molybdopterin molybdotransferase